MSRYTFLTLATVPLAAALALSAGPASDPTGGKKPPPVEVRPVVAGNTAFACDLYQKVREQKGNLILSPFSLSSALAMTSAGARTTTLSEMEKVLHLPSQKVLHPAMQRLTDQIRKADEVEVDIANALWGLKGKTFERDFLRLIDERYSGGFQQVDFTREPEKSRERINKWIAERTNDQIRNLVPAGLIKADTRLILTNAIHFKGRWASPFAEDATAIKPFRVNKETTRNVWLMKQRAEFRFHQQAEFRALELPYTGNALSLLILLPREEDGLAGVEKLLTPQTLAQLNRNMTKRRVEVFLPRFKMAKELSLSKPLQSMGLTKLFSDQADLSGLDGGKEKLALNEVVHKAFIDVHEKGTEAGGASAGIVGSRSIEIVPVFRADHPFLFLLRDNRNGTILFLGRVVDPEPMK